MKVLLLDTETTGLDSTKDRIIEIGVQVTDYTFQTVYAEANWLLWDASYPPITDEISVITGITMDDLAGAVIPDIAFNELNILIERHLPEYTIAYNAEYDHSMIKADSERGNFLLLAGIYQMLQEPWLCAMKDIETNYQEKCWRMSHLALEYGVPVDPSTLHRALGDVELMRKLLIATGQNANDLKTFRDLPWVYLQAKTKAPWEDNGRSNKLAKDRGYMWQTPKGDTKVFEKKWVKRVKESQVEIEIKESPFPVVQLKGD